MIADNRWARWGAHSETGRTDGAPIKNKSISKKLLSFKKSFVRAILGMEKINHD